MKLAVVLLCLGVAAQQPPKPAREMLEEREEAQGQLVACRLEGRSSEECRQAFQTSTGTAPDAVKERLELEKGAPLALLGTLENCTRDAKLAELNVSFADCTMRVKALLERLKNQTVTPEELSREIRKIAGEKAMMIVRRCSAAASTDAAKEACLSSTEALNALAELSGRAAGSVPEEELRSLFRRGAAEEVSEELRLCMTGADTDEKKKECFGSDDIREAVGNSMGRDKGDVKDSDVREFLDEGVKEEIWTLLESCPEDSKERCMTAAKEMLAAVSGEEASGIPDDKVRKLLDDEMASALGERMGACMAEAADDGARESCRTSLATGVLGVTRGEAPSRTDMEEALTEAGRNKAKEVSQSCQGSREECMEKLREEAAKSMGLSKEDLSDMEVERLNMDGARDAAKEAARGCAAARKEEASASCADPTEIYASARQVSIDDDVERERIKQELVKETEKDAMRTCMKESDKTGFERCMGQVTDVEEIAGQLFEGLSAERKENKQQRAKEEAAVEVVGERFQLCMEASETEEQMKACRDEIRDGASMAGLMEDVEDVVKKYQRNTVAIAARACNSTQRKACVDQAKEELKKSGLKERAFGVVRRLAEMKAAAETWAACQEQSAEANATCNSIAQAALEDISGSAEAWTEEAAEKVLELGQAMLEGKEIVLRKLHTILLEILTDALECSDAVLDKLADRAQQTSDGFMPNSTMGMGRNVSNKECKIVWGLARYTCRVHTKDLNETETDDLSDVLSTDLGTTNINVRRLGRRLAVVTESFAAQEEEETASDGTSTGTGTGTGTGTTTSTGAGTGTTTTERGAVAASSASFFASNPLSVSAPLILLWLM